MKPLFNTRTALFAGFGGLLLLMGLAGADAVGVLRLIQSRNDEIRRQFLARNDALEKIRADLYLSGTYMRDYLLEPDPALAESSRSGLANARREMDAALRDYQRLLPPAETQAFRGLQVALAEYWRILEPAIRWSPQQRAANAYPFLRDQVFERRTNMLAVADRIGHMNEVQLEAGTLSLSRLFSGFETRLGITLAATLSLGLLLAALTGRTILRLERESSVRYAEGEQARQELKQLSARLLDAQENERRSISRELHDEIGQSLSAVLVELSNLSAAIQGDAANELRDHVATIRQLAEHSVAAVRNMALLLRPSMLDDLGLVPALQWQARETSKRVDVRVDVAAENVCDELPEQYKTCIYRVVQEALHNVSRHAAARLVRISVRQESDRISLSIQDDGKGFPARHRGLGLLGMEERVENLGGTFRLESNPGHGTRIGIVLPLHSTPDVTEPVAL